MEMTGRDRLHDALELLRDGLLRKCEEEWREHFGDNWLDIVNDWLDNPQPHPNPNDIQFLLFGIQSTWEEVFSRRFDSHDRALIFEITRVRNELVHQVGFTSSDVLRALDSMERLLRLFGDSENRLTIEKSRFALMSQIVAVDRSSFSGNHGAVTRFSAQFTIESPRLTRHAEEIAEDLLSHLGSDVSMLLKITAVNKAGFAESTKRTLSENASNLGADFAEFE